MRVLWVCLLLILQGVTVTTATPSMTILPERSFFRPGDPVTLRVSDAPGSRLQIDITFGDQPVARLDTSVADGSASIRWQPPPDVPRGYGVNARAYADDGTLLASASTAFDVLRYWTDAPRYGFFSDFRAGRDDDAAVQRWLLEHHLNGIQFYDWQYRWEDLLPDGAVFHDGLGRPQSLITIRRLIDRLHEIGTAAMPYTAIYGVSIDFYRQHPDWALFDADGKPYLFGDNFMAILDPTPGSAWNQHLLSEYADVLANTAFDGIHIDQYGAPKMGFDASGSQVDLAEVMPAFIDQTADLVEAQRGAAGAVIFNAVGNWPVETVAPARQDAVYIEVWPPYNDFADLYRIVTQAQQVGGGKPVILAAYIPPDRAVNWRLANAIIFASGGSHIETGEPGTMLADPYFPKFGPIAPDDLGVFRRYYDFLVRYENRLSVGTSPPESLPQIEAEGLRTVGIRAQDRILPILRRGDGFETLSLVNFVGLKESDWNQPAAHAPTPLSSVRVTIPVERPVARVWFASPDDETTTPAQALTYSVRDGRLSFTLPRLDYWTMIVLEYRS